MTKLDAILEQARTLSPVELEELVRALSAQLVGQGNDDASVGLRGLAALTESTRAEDWTTFYPDVLRNGRRTSA